MAIDESTTFEQGDQEGQIALRPRRYQLEMLEKSMEKNIIVAMDTGSGKTLIALLRIQAELERCLPEQLVWFLTTTVALANQHHRAVSGQLPAYQARVLSSACKCELWSEQWIWDEMLKGIRIVVSTYEILREALVHGFVQMNQLALLVYDEAHHATKNHPASRILRQFYHSASDRDRPAILGLSASPLVSNKVGNLDTLETNLNAISRTPRLHRNELLQYVHHPELIPLIYPSEGNDLSNSPALLSLVQMYTELDIEKDPWIMELRSDPSTCNSGTLQKALTSHKTHCHDQVKDMCNKASYIQQELGSIATSYYIHQCIQKFRSGPGDILFASDGVEVIEKAYLRRKFAEVDTSDNYDILAVSHLSPKVKSLINFLMSLEISGFSGLVFVRTRAEVAVLAHILSVCLPLFAVSTFVGESSYSGRKSLISDLVDVKHQTQTLDDLRQGRKNLIVSTNALEEGIDVSACNAVVCFDQPPNLKSFIQRRGRARKSASKYAIMFQEGDNNKISNWQELEEEMKETYADEMRQLRDIECHEAGEEDVGEERKLRVESTGAMLNLCDAVSHLYHFCATLPTDPYVDNRPLFFVDDHSSGEAISARVVLPNSVDASVREACSGARWTKEKSAIRDAAFEAYKALYYAGLVNDNLLPLGHVNPDVDAAYIAVEKRPNLVEVSEQINIWASVARQWQKKEMLYGSLVTIKHLGNTVTEMVMILPVSAPHVSDFELHYDAEMTFNVSIGSVTMYDKCLIDAASEVTSLLLRSVFEGRLVPDRSDYVALFVPTQVDLQAWLHGNSRTVSVEDLPDSQNLLDVGLVRDISQNGAPHILLDVKHVSLEDTLSGGAVELDQTVGMGIVLDAVDIDQSESGTCVLLEAKTLPKRADFLHPVGVMNQIPLITFPSKKGSTIKLLPASKCEMDNLPFNYSRFALFIPSILHKVHVGMVHEQLCAEILSTLRLDNKTLMATAISASSAREPTDYQRLEFLGDNILKFFTSLTLMAANLKEHEGILSHKKDHIVSNTNLASAAMRAGLDKFILTKAFTGLKWRPLYIGDLLSEQTTKTRKMSSKTLADVVEALIGAACLDGGPEKAVACLAIFLPSVPWSIALKAGQLLYDVYEQQGQLLKLPPHVEQIIDYRFNLRNLLLEALTHPSHHGPNASASYQRLEFIGDSILDNIITTTAFAHEPPIVTHKLHLIRTALVNANFLGFLCLRLSLPFVRAEIMDTAPEHVSIIEETIQVHLWPAMRHASPAVRIAQQTCAARYKDLRAEISESLANGSRYPWTALARLEPPKFFSDIIESIIGAIYIDSHGSMETCNRFVEHLGLMIYLGRVMEGKIALLHPKEELGQLADQDKVRYLAGVEGEEGARRHACTIMVGDEAVVKVFGDGVSVMEVQTKAAEQGCNILRDRRRRARGEHQVGDDRNQQMQGKEETLKESEEEGEFPEESLEAQLEEVDDDDVYMIADEQ